MSTITYYTGAELAPEEEFSESEALDLFGTTPEAVRELIYGNRAPFGALPHDHGASGGAHLSDPILSQSFGEYAPSFTFADEGIPLSPPASGVSFAPDGADLSKSKRLASWVVLIPGGVAGVTATVVVSHTKAGHPIRLDVALRPLSSVNYALGRGPSDVVADISYPGATLGTEVHSADLKPLGELGDPTQDREVEASVWLSSNVDTDVGYAERLLALELRPMSGETVGARPVLPTDPASPEFSVRELRAGVGMITPAFVRKASALHNGLARALWGRAPGLSSDDTFDTRQPLRVIISDAHRHQGVLCADLDGSLYSDGAVIRTGHSAALVGAMLEDFASNTFLQRNSVGVLAHSDGTLATGWLDYRTRMSIPSGLGALLVRVGVTPLQSDSEARLFARVSVTPLYGGDSIVRTLSCAHEYDGTGIEVGVIPEDDPAFERNLARLRAGKGLWGSDARRSSAQLAAEALDPVPVRISKPIRVGLTHMPTNSEDPIRETKDYTVSVRVKLTLASGLASESALVQSIFIVPAPGY